MSFASKLFGEDKIKQQDTLNKLQGQLRDSMVGDVGRHTTGAIDTMGGYAQDGYNAYDDVEGDRLVGDMKQQLGVNHQKDMRGFANSNIGSRFSYARKAGENEMNNAYNQNLTNLDYQNLQTKTQAGQQAYGNQMDALKGVLGTAQGLMNPTQQNMQMHKPGALDYLSGIGGAVGTIKKMF